MVWDVLDTGIQSAAENMDLDRMLLASLERRRVPLLHFYRWQKPSITYGHFIDFEKLLNHSALKEADVQTAKRPTGGGVTFHMNDLSFSAVVPASHPYYSRCPLDNYRWINAAVLEAIQPFLDDKEGGLLHDGSSSQNASWRQYCMAHPTQYDVLLSGKKIGGAAQRRTKFGFLHQGTIHLSPLPIEEVRSLLCDSETILSGFQANSTSILSHAISEEDLEEVRQQIESNLLDLLNRSEHDE